MAEIIPPEQPDVKEPVPTPEQTKTSLKDWLPLVLMIVIVIVAALAFKH